MVAGDEMMQSFTSKLQTFLVTLRSESESPPWRVEAQNVERHH